MGEQSECGYDLFISHARDDRAWVKGYLLDALNAAGVRCHSEEAFRLGVPRLLEFERAIQQSKRTLLVLSPAYLAEGLSQFSDLLAQSYGLESATWPVIPLLLHPVQLPPRLAMLTALDATDPADWPEVVERLCAESQRAVPELAARPPCPYPGMVPFSEADSERFFGRDQEVGELVERLRLHPFVAVIGPSGSGKSSLVFAGLVPALRKAGLFGAGDWLVRSLRPGESPQAALDAALGSGAADAAEVVTGLLAGQPEARRLLLVVDQFEELFTLAREDQVQPFQQALQRLIEVPNCYVVLTVRADFYPELMAAPLWGAIQAHRFEVLLLDGKNLRQAIVRPAEDVGVFVETALVERLVSDAGQEPGVLPLVQETLVLLWERLERRFLPLRAYEALVLTRRTYGEAPLTGLQAAMARRADAALADLPPEQRLTARQIFLRLIQFGEGRADTRRQQPASALRSASDDPQAFDQTLRHLANHRLLTLGGEEESATRTVDIAHEALIAGWPTLQEWLDQRREAEQTRRRLEAKAQEWIRLGQAGGGLLDQVELMEAERWLASPGAADLGTSEALPALVEASRTAIETARREREAAHQRALELERQNAEEQQRRAEVERRRAEEQARASSRLRWLVAVLAVVLLLAVVAAVVAGIQKQQADRQVEITRSQKLAAHTLANLGGSLDLSLLLSKEAYDIDNSLDTRGSLLGAVTESPRLATFLHSHTDEVQSVSFSPDGKTLASGSWDHKIILWDVSVQPPTGRILAGHTDRVNSIAFSPVGQTLASGSSDGTIVLWELSGHVPISRTLPSTEKVWSLAFDPDGQMLASGTDKGEIILWDISANPPITSSLSGHTLRVTGLAFSPDGKSLASGSEDENVILWDVSASPVISQSLSGHQQKVTSLAFSPNGRTLVSGGYDLKAILWDVSSSPPTSVTLPTTAGVMSVAFHPDDNNVLVWGSFDYTIVLWDVEKNEFIDRQPLVGHSAPVLSVAFSPDGQMLASGGQDHKVILWDAAMGRSIGQPLVEQSDPAKSLVFIPGDSKLVSGHRNSHITLWDMSASPPMSLTLTGHTKYVTGVAASPDGTKLASGSEDHKVILWDISASPPLSLTLTGHRKRVNSVAFSADSQMLASGGADRKIILWSLSDTPPTSKTLKYTSAIWSVAFSPDGNILASGNDDNSIMLWDAVAGVAKEPPLTGHAEMVKALAFSPDGTTLASASHDKRIIFWDIKNLRPVGQPLTRHTKAVVSLSFSPNGDMLASSSYDGTVIVWNVPTGRSIAQLQTGQGKRVDSVAFSPDGKTLASGSYDQTIMLWKLVPEFWADRACQVANRNLSKEEWDRFVGSDVAYRCTCPDLPPGEGAPMTNCPTAP